MHSDLERDVEPGSCGLRIGHVEGDAAGLRTCADRPRAHAEEPEEAGHDDDRGRPRTRVATRSRVPRRRIGGQVGHGRRQCTRRHARLPVPPFRFVGNARLALGQGVDRHTRSGRTCNHGGEGHGGTVVLRSEVVGGRVLRLVEHDRVGAGHVDEGREPEPRSAMGPANVAPLASSSARVASRSSHISESSWCRGEECSRPSHTVVVGCTPTSLGPLRKMSQPPPESGSSTFGHPSTSRRKARVAGGSSE